MIQINPVSNVEAIKALIDLEIQVAFKNIPLIPKGFKIVVDDLWVLKIGGISDVERNEIKTYYESNGFEVNVIPFHSFVLRDKYTLTVK